MSYIRSTSNPERMYITSDGKFVEISHRVEPPLASSHAAFNIPVKLFERARKRWALGDADVKIGRLRVQEVHVFTDTGKRAPQRFNPLRDRRPAEFLIKLSYGRHCIYMWRVTWEYIVRGSP